MAAVAVTQRWCHCQLFQSFKLGLGGGSEVEVTVAVVVVDVDSGSGIVVKKGSVTLVVIAMAHRRQ